MSCLNLERSTSIESSFGSGDQSYEVVTKCKQTGDKQRLASDKLNNHTTWLPMSKKGNKGRSAANQSGNHTTWFQMSKRG